MMRKSEIIFLTILADKNMSTTQQAPKLNKFSIALIFILTFSAIVAPVVIVYFNQIQTMIKNGSDTATTVSTVSTGIPDPPAINTSYVIPIGVGTWNLTGRDTYNWTAKLVVQSVEKNVFSGYFDWYRNGNKYVGREHYQGTYDKATNSVTLKGTRLEKASGLALGTYKATLSTNGKELINGTWRGGTWKAILDSYTKKTEQNEIVGVWKGRYGTTGKATLTIHNDMTGEFNFVNTKSGSYKVSVEYSNGSYYVKGTKWIKRPANFVFYNLNGTIRNGVFSGTDFKLEKTTTAMPPNGTESEEKEKEKEKKKREAEANETLEEARSAFGNGKYDVAFQLYEEAAKKSTNGIAIKKEGAKKFFEKAKELINTLGECDAQAKKWLQYANQLNPSNDINTLLNLCN